MYKIQIFKEKLPLLIINTKFNIKYQTPIKIIHKSKTW